jgi:hypothetical protein
VAHSTSSSMRTFEVCVANNEDGEPGSLNPADIKGGNVFQFTDETWEAVGMSGSPESASEAEQIEAFRKWEPSHQGAWPNTIPPCLRYS